MKSLRNFCFYHPRQQIFLLDGVPRWFVNESHDVLLGERRQFLKDARNRPRAAEQVGNDGGDRDGSIDCWCIVNNDFGNEI